MRAITFHFFSGKTLAGWLIKARLSTHISHCVAEFEDGYVIDSMLFDGVHATTMAELPKPLDSITITVSDDAYERTYAHAKEQEGKGYDITAAVGFAFVKMLQDPDTLFCSELCYDLFSIATGVRLHTYTLITPSQLRLVLETYISTPNEGEQTNGSKDILRGVVETSGST